MLPGKKIRVTLSPRIIELIEKEAEFYEMTKNKICNLIFEGYRTTEYCDHSSCSKKRVMQFNLSVENMQHYENILNLNNVTNESEFFRTLLEEYERMSHSTRQIEIFKTIYNELERAVEKKYIVKIEYNDNLFELEPYFITSDRSETDNYLLGYSLAASEYTALKLRKIKKVIFTGKNFIPRDIEYIKNIKIFFDPSLSYGKITKIKIHDGNVKIFENSQLPMPKILSSNENIFVFECSEQYAKNYFMQFLDHVEILEPEELRKYFCNKIASAYKKYFI